MRDIGFIEAINEALSEEMERDSNVFIMGARGIRCDARPHRQIRRAACAQYADL
jgi:hypothetical protein